MGEALRGRGGRTSEGSGSVTGAGVGGVGVLDALPEDELLALLLGCCAAPGWAAATAARRPFGDPEALLAAAAEELAATTEADVDLALAAHPRIGERSAHAASRREQAAALGADAGVLAALADGNAAYEERFGHVYLVRAAGRSGDELLALLRERLTHDPATERRVLREQLAEINALRLTRALEDLAPAGGAAGAPGGAR